VRLDTGQGEPRVHVPRGRHEPVELKREVLAPALSALARDRRPPLRPQEAARRLFEVEARSGAYRYASRGQLTPLGPGEHLEGEPPAAAVELTRAYLRWCERTGRPGDCLRLLEEGPTVTGDGRHALALALAQGAVLDEMLEAFKDMADPHAMVAAALWTWTTYLVLLAIPDVTVSKGLAAVMTVTFIAYVGVDTFWSLIVGFKRLVDEVERATTFQALREAGERYGKVMGRNAARAFALLATAALGNTVAGLAAKVPTLPGAVVAAARAETQLGLRLAAVGEVESVAVSAGSVTLALAPGAVAMTAGGDSTNGEALHWDNWKSQRAFGHTFLRHGQGLKNTNNLRGRAAGTGTPQGQWTDNEAAARYLKDVRPGLDGPTVVPIPEGMGQVILPDGSILPTRHALVVPRASGGIETAYPVPGPR
jgi:hypothetical protein